MSRRFMVIILAIMMAHSMNAFSSDTEDQLLLGDSLVSYSDGEFFGEIVEDDDTADQIEGNPSDCLLSDELFSDDESYMYNDFDSDNDDYILDDSEIETSSDPSETEIQTEAAETEMVSEDTDTLLMNGEEIEEEGSSEKTIVASAVIGNETIRIYEEETEAGELFTRYVEREFQSLKQDMNTSGHGGRQLLAAPRLSGINADVYNVLKVMIEEVAQGNRASTAFEVSLEDLGLSETTWTAQDLGVESLLDDEGISADAIAAVSGYLYQIDQVLNNLVIYLPFDLYWFDKNKGVQDSGFPITTYYDETRDDYVLAFDGNTVISFAVSQEYAVSEFEVDTQIGTAVNTAKNKVYEIIQQYASADDYNKLLGYKNEICSLVTYNYEAAEGNVPYGNPWQLIWVFDGDASTNVVCEGYSKAFQYLCDLTQFTKNIRCITVTGTGTWENEAEPHMWNIVTMEDSKNYLADLTNCDGNLAGAYDQLFLAGAESGDVQNGYQVIVGSANIYEQQYYYYYDEISHQLYTEEELSLSPVAYINQPVGEEFIENDIIYQIFNGGATIIGYKGSPTVVSIPEQVRGVSVTAISNSAFCECHTLKRIELPSSLKTIQDGEYDDYDCIMKGSFTKCTQLEEVIFRENAALEYIGDWAFASCYSLKTISIPDHVKILGISCFEGCLSLSSIRLSEEIIEIAQNALSSTALKILHIPASCNVINPFQTLPELERVTVEEGNSCFFSDNGALYFINKNGYVIGKGTDTTSVFLWLYPIEKKENSYTVVEQTDFIVTNTLLAGGRYINNTIIPEKINAYLHIMDIGKAELVNLFISPWGIAVTNDLDDIGTVMFEVIAGDDNPYYSYRNRLLCNKEGDIVLRIPPTLTGTVVIPEGIVTIGTSAGERGSYSSIVFSQTVTTIGDFAFSFSDVSELVVPDTVSEIGGYAFYGCKELKKVVLPDGLSILRQHMFMDCEQLEEIVIPDSVQELGQGLFISAYNIRKITLPDGITNILDNTFVGCHKLEEIRLPSQLASIGFQAFDYSGLKSIRLPATVESVDYGAFSGCSSLQWIIIENPACYIYDSEETIYFQAVIIGHPGSTAERYAEKYNRQFVSIEDLSAEGKCGPDATWTFDNENTLEISGTGTISESINSIVPIIYRSNIKNVIIQDGITEIGDQAFKGCYSMNSIILPEGITSIGEDAFCECTSLSSISLPDSVRNIGKNAFWNCTSLSDIAIPGSVTSIEYRVFGECTSLTNVTLPESVTGIGEEAFLNCTSLTSITIPDKVKSIGEAAFINCISLTNIALPNGLMTIKEWAFINCSSLSSITIPGSVTSIAVNAFHFCQSLKEINIDASNGVYSSIEGVVYNNDVTKLIICPVGKEAISIPNSVLIIGDNAFEQCRTLTSITIPDSVIIIGMSAFYECETLASVTIPDSVISITQNAFMRCDPTLTIYGYGGSYAETFASENGISFVALSDQHDMIESRTMHRLYNPYTGEHLYTGSEAERDTLSGAGWQYDGVAWNAPVDSNIKVYRLYNPYGDFHFYSSSEEEIANLETYGWIREGVAWCSDEAQGTPIYRLFNPYVQTNYHMFTTSTAERDLLVSVGWQFEGVAFYGVA